MMMPNRSQMIAIGVGVLFGTPICIGVVVAHFFGFWAGVLIALIVLATIALIAQKWWNKRNDGSDS